MANPKVQETLELEEGSVVMSFEDVYVLFYLLVKQAQEQGRKAGQDTVMSFDLRQFKALPEKVAIQFEKVGGELQCWIPETPEEKKARGQKFISDTLFLPKNEIITP